MDTGVRFTATAQAFTPAVTSNAQRITPAMSVAMPMDVPEYDGPYEVTPAVDKQIMPTDQKLMTDDMTINAIPYYDVSNTSGGSTVYIG